MINANSELGMGLLNTDSLVNLKTDSILPMMTEGLHTLRLSGKAEAGIPSGFYTAKLLDLISVDEIDDKAKDSQPLSTLPDHNENEEHKLTKPPKKAYHRE